MNWKEEREREREKGAKTKQFCYNYILIILWDPHEMRKRYMCVPGSK